MQKDLAEAFQNISCYCLTRYHFLRFLSCSISKHLMLLFNVICDCGLLLDITDFKTSHVIV